MFIKLILNGCLCLCLIRRHHGLVQHEEPGPAGPEEAHEQDGDQDCGQPLHRRHQQRGTGRAVPGDQRVHAQPQGGPEDHQEPH